MFKNYLKTAWRNALKNKTYSLINVIGLTVGLLSFIFITHYIRWESSYDEFFKNSERIYRISLNRIYPERTRLFASSPVTLAPTLLENYPEVESATRMHRLFFNPEVNVRIEDKTFVETKYLFTDSCFFRVFSLDFVEGDPLTALNAPNKVVLTKETAERYFGDQPALNQTFQLGNVENIVSAVVNGLPGNAHFHFDLMGSIHALPFIQNAINSGSWMNPWVYTYIKLREGENAHELEAKFPLMVDTYGQGNLSNTLGQDYKTLGHRLDFFLQPLEDIHLHSKLDIEVEPTSNASYLYLLAVVAFFILIMSCINFINLSTARSAERGREVGIRKVLGSTRPDLIRQFIFESVGVCLFSLILASGLAYFLSGSFNQLIGRELDLWDLVTPFNLIAGILIAVGIGIAAGIYPALVITSVNSAEVLKGNYKSSERGQWLRNSLIVIQFFITITMISGAFFVGKQMKYLESKDLGFDKEQVVVLRQAFSIGQNFNAFKNELKQIKEIAIAGGTNAMPGDFMGSNIFRPLQSEYSDLRANVAYYDDDFIETMGYKTIEGRGFSEEFDDSNSIIINQAAAREMGFEEPVGKRIQVTNVPDSIPSLQIVGVLEDFHFASLHSSISPVVIYNTGDNFVPSSIAIRTHPSEYNANIPDELAGIWNQFVPEQEMRLSYLDDELDALYASDRLSGKVFGFFTYVAIVIAFIGLFSLASYVIQMRTKEISMRKVLGASVLQIFILLSKNFVLLVLGSLALSVPVSYYAANEWLAQFAYHIPIDWIVFIESGVIAIVLVMAAVSYQSIRIYMLNPGQTLKAE